MNSAYNSYVHCVLFRYWTERKLPILDPLWPMEHSVGKALSRIMAHDWFSLAWSSKTIPTTKVRQQSHIKADATPVMHKSFENLLSNNFQVIIFERIAKNCFNVNILSKICQNICFSIKKVIIFYFLYIHELHLLMIITIYYHYLNF